MRQAPPNLVVTCHVTGPTLIHSTGRDGYKAPSKHTIKDAM